MSQPGSNLPGYRQVQLDFAAHIRHPDINPRPAEIEPRRMQIYIRLFYNNIESFLSNSFPVSKRILGEERWHAMVRDFVHRHASISPYFLQIPEEFIGYLQEERNNPNDPPFLVELCHYEWLELALDVAEDDIPEAGIDPKGDLLTGKPVVSPVALSLAYQFPVHQIGMKFQPQTAPEQPTYLIVYRNRHDRVRFMESNAVTARLLELLTPEQNTAARTGRDALEQIAKELNSVQPDQIVVNGSATLERLRKADIIVGTHIETD